MLSVMRMEYNELSDVEKKYASNNGCGKEYATYVKVVYNGDTIFIESDAMEPEDATFSRDLSWIFEALSECYELGRQDKE